MDFVVADSSSPPPPPPFSPFYGEGGGGGSGRRWSLSWVVFFISPIGKMRASLLVFSFDCFCLFFFFFFFFAFVFYFVFASLPKTKTKQRKRDRNKAKKRKMIHCKDGPLLPFDAVNPSSLLQALFFSHSILVGTLMIWNTSVGR